jgi:hypothetical protein
MSRDPQTRLRQFRDILKLGNVSTEYKKQHEDNLTTTITLLIKSGEKIYTIRETFTDDYPEAEDFAIERLLLGAYTLAYVQPNGLASMEKKPDIHPCKYEYLLTTWGGFWNPGNIEIHGEPKVHDRWFDTREARDAEATRLQDLAERHGRYLLSLGRFNDSVIAGRLSEGYLTRHEFVIQSHVKVGEEIRIIENNLGFGFWSHDEFDELGEVADYMKEWRYDLGNDLPDDAERLYSTLILRLPG